MRTLTQIKQKLFLLVIVIVIFPFLSCMFWGLTDNLVISVYPKGYSSELELHEDYLFITNPQLLPPYIDCGVSIFNITDPTSINYISSSEFASDTVLQVSGSNIYCLDSYNLSILDISDIYNPNLVGSETLNTASSFAPFKVVGNYLYGGSFSIVDVSDPTNPGEISTLAISEITDIEIINDTAYLVNETGLFIVDVSIPVPATLNILAHYPNISSIENRNIFVSNNFAYITGWSSGLVGIIDISDSNAPKEVDVIPNISNYTEPTNMALWGTSLYISSTENNQGISGNNLDETNDKILIYKMQTSGLLELEKILSNMQSIWDIELSDQFMYLASEQKIYIVLRP